MLIYLVRHRVSGKGYVGQTACSDHSQRLNAHRKGNRKGSAIAAAVRKYGWDSFESSVLETCTSQAELDEAEAQWIERLGTLAPAGYNIRGGGHGGGRMSDDCKKKQSDRMRGRTLTPEHRKKIGDGVRGYVHTPERNRKISEALRGRKITWRSGRQPGFKLKLTAEQRARMGETGRATVRRLLGEGLLSFAGEHNPNAKLGWKEVQEIRAMWAIGDHSQQALGDLFGIRQTAISRIVRGLTWKGRVEL